jgi:hypothetical protein
MPTFIKTGFWEKRINPPQGYRGELNLDRLIAQNSTPGATGPQGPTGAQGIQGNTGTPGAVGPAGLTWRNSWVSGTSYILNDAVGYNGASWFCILATSGTTAPNVDTTHWALLASQGAIGPQGVQGPQGPQGAGASQTLQQTVDLGNEVTDGFGNTTKIFSGAVQTEDILGKVIIGSDVDLQKGIYTARIYNPGNHTANRTYTLPNDSGTIALNTQLPTVAGNYANDAAAAAGGIAVGNLYHTAGVVKIRLV